MRSGLRVFSIYRQIFFVLVVECLFTQALVGTESVQMFYTSQMFNDPLGVGCIMLKARFLPLLPRNTENNATSDAPLLPACSINSTNSIFHIIAIDHERHE